MSTMQNPVPGITPEPAGSPKTRNGWKRFWFAMKVIEVRLRFVAVLVLSAALIGYWDVVKNYYEKYTSPESAAASGHVHSDSEYFCPMHTFITRDHFDKCPICGMDLVKRRKGEKADLPAGVVARVQTSPMAIAEAGVKTEVIGTRLLSRETRVVGQIELSETGQATIANRFPGRVEKLLVNYVGAQVKKGDPVAQIYSPEFLAAAKEYVLALQSVSSTGAALANAARDRLLLAGFTEEQVSEIARTKQVPRLITYHTPVGGTVLEKKVVEGDYTEEGAPLLSIADLNRVWVQARVLESDLGSMRIGLPVEVRSVAWPGIVFIGNVSFIYPTVDPESRSVKVRVEITNPGHKLRPGMYVTAVIRSPVGRFEPLETPDLSHLSAVSLAGLGNEGPLDTSATSATVYAVRLSGVTRPGARSGARSEWEEGYTCVMHPDHFQEQPGICTLCDCGMKLTRWRRQKVLAVPENAVIDTGTRRFVYVEQAPGVFDARKVILGTRTGSWYEVLEGLKPGMEIATNGSFLIDAENRLDPGSEINKPDEEKKTPAGSFTVVVKGGYEPEVLEVASGPDRRIIFDRRDEGVCTEKVVFPSLGIEKDLPPYQKTVIELPATASGEIEYTCGMDMLRGKIVVGSAANPPGQPAGSGGHAH